MNYIQTSKLSRSISVLNKAKTGSGSQFTLHPMLFLPYFNYCIEIWGNNYMSSINAPTILHKRAIGVIHNVCYLDHTHSFFLQSKLLKFTDIVKYQTAQFMYKAKNNLLPQNLQKLFRDQEGGNKLRGKYNFKINGIRTNRKRFCF